ncbi:branched-chain amino acid transport system substrate-binding protein [Allocatelliglobosispora scoriae]|uniref:Branched-chain amino acid transport system substrate-binding protein n=1 Tax=Allocatelliglobosispora scoriae TaxID=643052 RepID=A0A841BRB8_9ACTN|nr:branched-chain amino acid transport system substrate-binding protein [Allocatelliglobosispora scoriae]
MVLAAAGCSKTPDTPADAAKCGGKVAIFGAFTGGNAGVVTPSRDGAKLAVEKFNAANPKCLVTLVEFDTEGDGAKATPVANQVAQDQSFVAVIGGAFSGETRATMPIYEAAGLVMVSQSATATDLTTKGNKAFHRVVGNDDSQGPAAASYIKNVLKSQKAYVVDDGTTYGGALGATVKTQLGAIAVGSDKVQEKQVDFAATVSKVKNSGADAVFYGGYVNEAAPFLKQLRAAGYTGKFIGGDGIYDTAFATAVGAAAAEGAIITCPCIPSINAKGSFPADFKAKYTADPGPYAAEGWDAATVLLDGFKAGKTTRKELLDWVNAYNAPGLTKTIKFDPKGEVEAANVVIWAYVVKGGVITPDVEVPKS